MFCLWLDRKWKDIREFILVLIQCIDVIVIDYQSVFFFGIYFYVYFNNN